jgi:hypothetical protein
MAVPFRVTGLIYDFQLLSLYSPPFSLQKNATKKLPFLNETIVIYGNCCTFLKYFALNISNIIQSKMYIHIGTLQKMCAFVIVWNILRNKNFENKTICKRRSGWTRKITRLNILAFSTNVAIYKWKVHHGKIEIISFVVKFNS